MSSDCQICAQPAHGKHFGVDACRACAAFFRRYHNIRNRPVRTLSCRKMNQDCAPYANGRWYCKQCRLAKCIEMGMTPDNIQYDRDLTSTSSGFLGKRKNIPTTVEQVLAKPLLVLWLQKEKSPNKLISFFDFNEILENLGEVFRSMPMFTENTSSLHNLSAGLRAIRKSQQSEHLVSLKKHGRKEQMSAWEDGILGVATWLSHIKEFRDLAHRDKLEIVKCIWIVFSTLERIAMTAEMRMKKLCGRSQFVISHNELVDFELSVFEVEWLSNLPIEQLEFFLGPVETWYKTHLVDELIALHPSETELTFLLASLCFQITGAELGGHIQQFTERMQDVLANDLHDHYVLENQENRYSHRLVKLLNVGNEYKRAMNGRRNNVTVGVCMDAFIVDFSHPEMFKYAV